MTNNKVIEKIIELHSHDKHHEVFELGEQFKDQLESVKIFAQIYSIACIKLEKYIDAEKALISFLSKADFDKDICMNLGFVQMKLGKYLDAIKNYKIITKNYPDSYQAFNNLGNCYLNIRDFRNAHTALLNSIAINNQFPLSHYNLGNVLENIGNKIDAEISYKNAISINPDYIKATHNLAVLLNKRGLFKDAEEKFVSLINKAPKYSPAYINYSAFLLEQNRPELAKQIILDYLKLGDDLSPAYNILGLAYNLLGETEKGLQFLKESITYNKNNHRPYCNILDHYPEDIDSYFESSVADFISRNKSYELAFSYGYFLERKNLYEKSFGYIKMANELKRSLFPYSIKSELDLHEEIINNSSKFLNINNNQNSNNNPKMIFIVGMPRSGTTLVEQILSCHSEIFGAGEIEYISQYGKEFSLRNTINQNDINLFRENFFNLIKKFKTNKKIIIDKMPQNFLYIHLILEIFKDAKIINLKRKKHAVCWSIYRSNFAHMPYSNNLEDIYKFYESYIKVMEFWNKTYPNRIHTLDYDSLVEDKNKVINELIDYLDIDWQDAMLKPYKNPRIVKTVSKDQVKKPIYKGSSEKWTSFKSFIEKSFTNINYD